MKNTSIHVSYSQMMSPKAGRVRIILLSNPFKITGNETGNYLFQKILIHILPYPLKIAGNETDNEYMVKQKFYFDEQTISLNLKHISKV